MKPAHLLYSTSSFLMIAGLLVGCGGTHQSEGEGSQAPAPVEVEAGPPVVVGSAEQGGLTITAMPDSPSFPGATLTLDGPADRIDPGALHLEFGVEGYELGAQTEQAGDWRLANSAKGQHIHLILDNGPYSAHYEPHAEAEVADGHHVLLAFLSRSYHESVKEASAFVVRQFMVGEGEAESVDLAAPHMFYSRPKGTYVGGDTEQLMLDFFLVNTTLSEDGNRVRATINGTSFLLVEWVPYVIEGLPKGEVEIRLELLDNEGNLVPGPFNDVTRTVMLEAGDEAAAAS